VEIRELPLDAFGGPARGSSRFIVAKRAYASQFEAITIIANRVCKMKWRPQFSAERRAGGIRTPLG